MPEIQPGQIYRSLSSRHHPCDGPTRILIKSWAPYGAGNSGAGNARVVTLGRSGKELRERSVSLDQLHDSPLTRDGQPRRTGYVLEASDA